MRVPQVREANLGWSFRAQTYTNNKVVILSEAERSGAQPKDLRFVLSRAGGAFHILCKMPHIPSFGMWEESDKSPTPRVEAGGFGPRNKATKRRGLQARALPSKIFTIPLKEEMSF
jgi:hypothetical protein